MDIDFECVHGMLERGEGTFRKRGVQVLFQARFRERRKKSIWYSLSFYNHCEIMGQLSSTHRQSPLLLFHLLVLMVVTSMLIPLRAQEDTFHRVTQLASVQALKLENTPETLQSAVKLTVLNDRSSSSVHKAGGYICDVSVFGAVGNGKVLDTSSIQSSIDTCAGRGGGIVHVPPGIYLTATLFLKSNITLRIDQGATILASPDQQNFPPAQSQWYTIIAENAENVEITGGGVVDGQGLKYVVEFAEKKNVMVSWNETGACSGDECRPRLIGFINCKNVHVWNILLQEPAYWCLHILDSDGVSIHDLSIYGDFNTPNTDGIDIQSSNNTVIKACHIDTGDDAICPKTTSGPLYNLTVTDCWIRTKSSAVKLGSDSRQDFHSLHFERLTIVDSHRGLGLQLRDSGNISNVTFANIQMSTRYYDPSWWGLGEPIYVTACNRDPSSKVGSIRNVRFINITATSENGIFLAGSNDSHLQGLEFTNISIKLVRSTNYTGGLHDHRPGCQGLVEHRMSGVFMEYIENMSMEDVELSWSQNALPDWGLPLDFTSSTVYSLDLEDFQSSYPS